MIQSLKKVSRPRTEKLEISSICSMALDSVVEESISPADGKTGNQFDLFDGTEKAEPVRPHSKTASRITSDAMRGLSPRAETTSTLQSSTASRSSNKPVRSRSDRPGSKSTRKSISEP